MRLGRDIHIPNAMHHDCVVYGVAAKGDLCISDGWSGSSSFELKISNGLFCSLLSHSSH